MARINKKVNPRKKLTTSGQKLEPRTTATSQPEAQTPEQTVEGKGRIRSTLQQNTGNRTTSKWKRKLGNRLKKKQASSTMWHDVDTKWNAHQETLKTKAICQEVEQISKVVNLMQSQENDFNKLMEEINSLNCSIDASTTRTSNADIKVAAENERVRQGVKDGSIPSAVVDSGTTLNVMKPGDPCIKTGRNSAKQYKMATGQTTPGGKEGLLEHELRDPARLCDIVPGITEDSLISTSKMADAGYISIFDGEEVNIYNANNTKITVTRGAVLRGWRDATCGLWRIPLVKNVTNENSETVLVKAPPTELLPN